MQYYVNLKGQTIGPMTQEQVFAYPVTEDTQVSKDGGPWQPLYSYPELMQMYQLNRPGFSNNRDVSSKKTLCGVMALLLGSLGIQYFVIGKTTAGILTILLTAVTCGLWELIVFIQGIVILFMSDEEFERKFLNTTSTFPLF